VNAGARSSVIRFAEARQRVPTPAGERAVLVMKRGTLDVKLSVLVPPNVQTPHEQDEIYFIVSGHGILVHEGKRDAFTAGDLLFVAAGVEHHYEDFSDDLALWRVFFGARGGEIPLGGSGGSSEGLGA
jgi:mannose-6-phosphate isomerase-like protein (cupin superfamily)